MNNCKHCMGVKKNAIGETIALCEHSDRWENVTLGDCFGNCDGQEYTRDYIAKQLERLQDVAYGYHINDKVLGMPCTEFEVLMGVAARMVLGNG